MFIVKLIYRSHLKKRHCKSTPKFPISQKIKKNYGNAISVCLFSESSVHKPHAKAKSLSPAPIDLFLSDLVVCQQAQSAVLIHENWGTQVSAPIDGNDVPHALVGAWV